VADCGRETGRAQASSWAASSRQSLRSISAGRTVTGQAWRVRFIHAVAKPAARAASTSSKRIVTNIDDLVRLEMQVFAQSLEATAIRFCDTYAASVSVTR